MKQFRYVFFILFILTQIFTACSKDDDEDLVPKKPEKEVTNKDNSNNSSNQEEEGTLTTYRIEGNNIVKLEDHKISDELVSFQKDVNKHQEMWALVKKIVPENYRTFFNKFLIIHSEEIAGYVSQTENDLSKWKMGLAINMAYTNGILNADKEFSYTIIHEFGHVLTLNNTQVEAPGDANNTSTFFTGEGSSKTNSYINQFFQKFWKEIYEEHQGYNQDDVYKFYEKYKDRFVTDYAATNPGEDIAESFAYFVTKDNKPEPTNIANKKVLFMYNYPELVELRNKIRSSSTKALPAPGSWKSKSIYKIQKKEVLVRR
ncbi:MAG: hypothetical protein ACEPOZ_01900 [Marinifilaceae bacterium]